LFQTFHVWLLSCRRFAAQTGFFKHALSLFLSCAFVALFSSSAIAAEENPLGKFSKILPEKVGNFSKSGVDKNTTKDLKFEESLDASDFNVIARFHRIYKRVDGLLFSVVIYRASSEDSAYSLFSMHKGVLDWSKCDVGTACSIAGAKMQFVRGSSMVYISLDDPRSERKVGEKYPLPDGAIESIAKLIVDNLDAGEGDIPALVKHLPEWEKRQNKISYVLTHNALRYASSVKDSSYINIVRPIIDSAPFESESEAVVGFYERQGTMVVIEYGTPQMATDADQRITQKINELKSQNQPVPTAYKRVGNYSVFVFDAPDEATANNLINQVEYGKTVQWLSGDPYEYDRANRRYLMTAGNIIITVLKTSGLALLVCFVIGGGFGYFVFVRRRRQQAIQDAFTDAGGMMRLNLDEMTPQTDPSRLLEK
jgi:hypothetical protein